jgi:hypothetical protein
MAARFVQLYRKRRKNDGNDYEAICEPITRPNMRLCAGEKRRAVSVHRVRP